MRYSFVRSVFCLWVWAWFFAGILFVSIGADAGDRPRVLMIGDSIIAGYGLAEEDAIPSRLAAILVERGIAVEVMNAGVSGETTAGGRARMGWLLEEPVDAVVVALGGNDVLRGLSPKASERNLRAILRFLRKREIPVLLIGMRAPANLGQAYTEQFDAVFPRLADSMKVLFYPFLLEGVALEPSYNQPDGIHPNADGARIIAEKLVPYMVRLLDAVRR